MCRRTRAATMLVTLLCPPTLLPSLRLHRPALMQPAALMQLPADWNATASLEGAIRKVTGDESYRFGDLTKKAAGGAKEAVEDVVRKATGDDGYEFGDLTKRALSDADRALSDSLGDLSCLGAPIRARLLSRRWHFDR